MPNHYTQRDLELRNERLTACADLLEKLANENKVLDMGIWSGKCGTVRCAVGWHFGTINNRGPGPRIATNGMEEYYPVYAAQTGFDAVSAYYRIPLPGARHLFELSEYEKPPSFQEVADRIRRYIGTLPYSKEQSNA